MEIIHSFIKSVEPIQYIYGFIAIAGGIARYLTGYKNGVPFKFSIFLASAVVAGFSGWMFAQMGTSLRMSQELIFVMAGTGGFMGEQTMKLIAEWLQSRISTRSDNN